MASKSQCNVGIDHLTVKVFSELLILSKHINCTQVRKYTPDKLIGMDWCSKVKSR